MVLVQAVIGLFYYGLIAFVAMVLVMNLVRSKHWEEEVLYVVVLIPFLLRLFRLK